VTTIAGSWMKAVDASPASTSMPVDPQAETLRLFQEHGTALFRFFPRVPPPSLYPRLTIDHSLPNVRPSWTRSDCLRPLRVRS